MWETTARNTVATKARTVKEISTHDLGGSARMNEAKWKFSALSERGDMVDLMITCVRGKLVYVELTHVSLFSQEV